MPGFSTLITLPLASFLAFQGGATPKPLSPKKFCEEVTVSLKALGWKTHPSLAMGAIAAWEKFENKKKVLRLTVLDLPVKMENWKGTVEMMARYVDPKAVVKVLYEYETSSNLRGMDVLTVSTTKAGIYNWMRQIDVEPGKPLTFLGTASIPKDIKGKALEQLLRKKNDALRLVLDSAIEIQICKSLEQDKAGIVSFAFAKMRHKFKLPKNWVRKDMRRLRWEDSKGKGEIAISVIHPSEKGLPKLAALLEQRTQVKKEQKPSKKRIKEEGSMASIAFSYKEKKKRVWKQIQAREIKGLIFVIDGKSRTSRTKKQVKDLLASWSHSEESGG